MGGLERYKGFLLWRFGGVDRGLGGIVVNLGNFRFSVE